MEVRPTSAVSTVERQESARSPIDQGALRSILSNLSHELCRPLVSLKAGFELLLSKSATSITPDQRGHLLTMASLCDDLLRLTRSYLDYAGIVQGSRPICLGSFTVGALVDEIDRQFAPVARARQLQWEYNVDSPEVVVVTDASRCQQIFGNLVSNAIKYTPVGGKVRVTGKADADFWVVMVSDTGPGIPADALERVFEPFFRLAREERSLIEGSGLGLAICGELVAQLHGEISLDSATGKGTTVAVRLPIAQAGTLPASSPRETCAPAARPKVDDSRSNEERAVDDAAADLSALAAAMKRSPTNRRVAVNHGGATR
jgi:signal transduction histidine kinase